MKTLTGIVISDKMMKSATVEVEHLWTHPKYKKTIRKTKKYIVNNEVEAHKGDKVELTEIKPMSRLKHFSITKIIEAARVIAEGAAK